MSSWYVFLDREHGPIDSATLKRWADSGRVTPNTKVRQGEQGKWVLASQVKGLFPDIPETSVAAPTPPPLPHVAQQPRAPAWWNRALALLRKPRVKYASLASGVAIVALVVVALVLGVVGQASGGSRAIDVVKECLDFRKSARLVAVKVPTEPYVEFRVGKQFQDELNTVYSSIELEGERPSKDMFAVGLLLGMPIEDYAIDSMLEAKAGRYEVVVSEARYDPEAFARQLGLDRLFEHEASSSLLADKFIAEWPKNYEDALELPTTTDSVTYFVQHKDGRIVIVDVISKRAEEEAARRTAETKQAVSSLSVISCEVDDYSDLDAIEHSLGDVSVRGIIKNRGTRTIETRLDVQVELLDRKADQWRETSPGVQSRASNRTSRMTLAYFSGRIRLSAGLEAFGFGLETRS